MKKIINLKVMNLLGHGLFYTVAVSIESIAPFVLAPVLTHYLSVYEYGLWAIFQSAMAFLRPILGMTFDDFIRMRYYQQSRDETLGSLFSIVMVSGFLALTLGILGFVFSDAISHILRFPAHWFWAVVACAWLYALFYIFLAYYQFDANRLRFATIHLIQALVTVSCSLMLVWEHWGWTGPVIGKLTGLFCGAGIAFFWLARGFPKSAERYIQPRHVIELVSFGWRYMGNGLVIVVVILTDRLLLANMQGVGAASLFSVASLFPMVLAIVIQGFIFGWQPWCFSRLARHHPEDPRHLLFGALFYLVALPIGGLILSWGACWLGPYVIDKQFSTAFDYVFPLTMAMVAQGFYQFAQTILQYYQKLGLLSWIAFATMGLNLLLNYWLIQTMGTIGSAWATCIAYGIAFAITAAVAGTILRKRYLILIRE